MIGKYPWSEQADKRRKERRPKPKPKFVKIKPASKKRARQNKEYQVLRIQYLIDQPICEAKVKCWGNRSMEVHHMAGRMANLLTDPENFLGVCSACHRAIEENPAMAKEMGLSVNRIT